MHEVIDKLNQIANQCSNKKSGCRRIIFSLRPYLAKFDDDKRNQLIREMHTILANIDVENRVIKRLIKRLLVLTDVGEEIDDEGALWIILKVLDLDSSYEVDIVFCTGDLKLRCDRWVSIIRGQEELYKGRVRYYTLNRTNRRVRNIPNDVTESDSKTTRLDDLTDYQGGLYDVVFQISPLGDKNTPIGTLTNVKLRDGATTGSYILIGAVSSTNSDKNSPIHDEFIAHLLKEGFLMSCVTMSNYAPWTQSFVDTLPPVCKRKLPKTNWGGVQDAFFQWLRI